METFYVAKVSILKIGILFGKRTYTKKLCESIMQMQKEIDDLGE